MTNTEIMTRFCAAVQATRQARCKTKINLDLNGK